jgi:indolepyruvate ferredoxin oxidoreductase beta subunit
MKYDIYLVGVGGQGVLTIGEIIGDAAIQAGIPANFYPTKGMAQRGGFVKAQLKLGRARVGPQIPERGADLVIGTELSEALKAVRYVRPGGEFLLYGHVWEPTAVMLGKAPYPTREQVLEQVQAAGATARYLDPAQLPTHDGRPVPINLYVLGAAVGQTALGGAGGHEPLLDVESVGRLIAGRWKRGVEANVLAFQAGAAGK